MITAQLVAETLGAWRDAERALQRLPPGAPDHETVLLIIAELRTVYAELTDRREASRARLEASKRMVERALVVLERFRLET